MTNTTREKIEKIIDQANIYARNYCEEAAMEGNPTPDQMLASDIESLVEEERLNAVIEKLESLAMRGVDSAKYELEHMNKLTQKKEGAKDNTYGCGIKTPKHARPNN